MIAPPVRLLKCVANINGDIDADFIDQSQRAHRHAPSNQCIVNSFRLRTALEKLGCIKQIRKQNAVDQKTRAVVDNDRQFSNLSHKRQAPLARFI